jgi:DNA-binding IclR family transcriptional regulator
MDRVAAKREYGVKSVSRALLILEAFTLEQPILSLNNSSNKTGFYKSSILRQIKTLREAGYTVRDPETGRYRLGTKFYILGQIFLRSSSLLESAGPILKAMASELGETASIFVADGNQRLFTFRLRPH